MFEIGWTEMLVIAVVMIVVVGPKDLPQMLRQFGRSAAKLRAMAGDFRKQFDEALKEAELDDVKKSVDQIRGLNPMAEVRKQVNPFAQAAQEVRSGIETAMKPKAQPPISAEPASPVAESVEPLKPGPSGMPASAAPLFETRPAAAPTSVVNGLAEPAPIASPPPAEAVAKPAARRRKPALAEGAAKPAAKRAPRKSAETPS